MSRTSGALRASPPLNATASVAKACDVIRKGIQDGSDAGGSWIREMAVAERAQVSRTSVRQALNVLAAEGYVELYPNRGAMVIDWTDENLLQVFDLRAMLEAQACELAAQHRSEEDVDTLRREADRFSELVERASDRNRGGIAECNNRLHRGILAAARNPRLTSMLVAVVQIPLITQTFIRYDRTALARSAAQHQDLVTAIASGDREWAHATMRAHVLAAKHVIFRGGVKSHGPGPGQPTATPGVDEFHNKRKTKRSIAVLSLGA